jgi:DNA-binding beta-propeller fold protein YncE
MAGETVGMKFRRISDCMILVGVVACLWVNGCSSSTANQVVVTVTPASGTLVVTQSVTFTAIVTGASNVSSTFDCTYTTTPNPTTAVPSPKPSAAASCTSANGDVGVLSNIDNTSTTVASTATFTAPKTFPDPTKFPNLLITITATSKSSTSKKGTAVINIDSGIRIQIVPATATLATGEAKQFLAEDFNGVVISNSTLKWDVTADAIATISSKTCTPTCGTVDGTTGTYTAPATVPTQATATLFAVSTIDTARIAQASITIVTAGNITFSGISPSIAPQGGLQQDIFLSATNSTSQIGVTLSGPSGSVTLDPSQIKVVFAAGAASASIGARIRLSAVNLKTPGHYMVGVTSSNTSIKVTGGPFPLDIIPVRPTIVGSSPDNFEESTIGTTGGTPFVIDGGYYGPPASPTVVTNFNGHALLTNTSGQFTPTARRIGGSLPPPTGPGHTAGLYPFSVTYTTSPGPFPAPTSPTAYTNVAVIPDYGGTNPPTDVKGNSLPPAPAGPPTPVTFPSGSAPSAIAIDSVLGYAVVTLAGANTPQAAGSNVNTANNVQFIKLSDLAAGTPPAPVQASSTGLVATGVAVDEESHVATVVNYASRNLSVLSIPSGTLVATVDLSGVIPLPNPPSSNPSFSEPFPYSVGVDPFSDRAVVAFASTNIGLIVNLNPNLNFDATKPNPHKCLTLPNTAPPYCPIAYVTLNTGAHPQIAFENGARLAYVTPGGAGVLSAVSLANPASSVVQIASATRASNVVTITTATPHNLNPANAGTVLISGMPQGKNGTNFNGSFAVGIVLDANNFQYSQADKDDSIATCPAACNASSGVPFLTYRISPSDQGIAINPVTSQLVLADPNVTFSQVTYIDAQSQTVTSMTLFLGATGLVSTGAPELGATNVAFQPFSNTAVSFNPQLNQVSLLDPSNLQRLAIVPTGQNATTTVCAANCTSTTPTNVSIPGAIAVDANDNLALAVNSGSNNISVFRLGMIKAVHIEQVLTPAIDSSSYANPAQLAQAVKIISGVAAAPVGPVRILGSGFTNSSQVRLNGVALPSGVTFVSSQELDVTIPVSIPDPSAPGGTLGILTAPGNFGLDVVTAGVGSNVVNFTVLEEVPLPSCSSATSTTPTAAAPGGVAVDNVHNLALVTNTGCNQVSVISINPANNFGTILKAIPTGGTPTGVAVIPGLAITGQPAGSSGVAVVTNSSANTVSILDLASLTQVAGVTDIAVGTSPSGVAIDQETNLVVIANSGSNTVSTIDLTPLTATPIGTLAPVTVAVDQNPIAVAIDPDRGTNGRGLAVVTSLVLTGAAAPVAALDSVDIGGTTPVKLNVASACGGGCGTPTGIVFDPAVSPALFYVVSTQGNQITAFNPDTNGTSSISVGINPTSIAYNFQTSSILSVNALSNSTSIVDSQTFRTKETVGIGGASRFSVAIQTFTNLAVIADQANNRVLLFPIPK